MQPLIIMGFGNHNDDWQLAQSLRNYGFNPVNRECSFNSCNHNNAVRFEDINASDADAVYSWGYRSIMGAGNRTRKKKLFFMCLGVDDGPTTSNEVPAPANYDICVAVQISEAFPRSNYFKGGTWIDILDPELYSKILHLWKDQKPGEPVVVNIAAKSLWPKYTNGITLHTATQNRQEVLALGVWLFQNFSE